MSFETDIRSRLAALAVTPERLEAVTAMRETVRRRCRPALDRYFASWDKLPAFGQVTPDNRRDLAAAQAEFFDRLFSGEMDAAYVDRLRALVGQEETNGFGVRIHLAAAANLLLELFEEIGRDRRWSGTTTARMCSDVLRFMVVDTLNAFHIGQELLKQRVFDRREAIDGALGEFGTAAVELQDSMADASRTFSATSEATAAAIAAALVAAERTGEAADRGQENLLTTAGASAQLVSSIGEVDRLASHSLDAVRLATANVGSLKQEIGELDRAATAIGSVVTLIAGVASQTNLLALNATIEAARAGEAGRGFSVVAAEVKTLAGQTAEATRAIAAQIGAIQAASTRSGEQLAAIVSVIARVEEMSAAAAAATSEQALATASIADQAQAASDAVGTIRAAATAMRELMGELRTTATGMDEASQRLSANGDRFQTELGRLSERLTAA